MVPSSPTQVRSSLGCGFPVGRSIRMIGSYTRSKDGAQVVCDSGRCLALWLPFLDGTGSGTCLTLSVS